MHLTMQTIFFEFVGWRYYELPKDCILQSSNEWTAKLLAVLVKLRRPVETKQHVVSKNVIEKRFIEKKTNKTASTGKTVLRYYYIKKKLNRSLDRERSRKLSPVKHEGPPPPIHLSCSFHIKVSCLDCCSCNT